MHSIRAYLPIDRRRGSALPELGRGAVLFADISGFSHLTHTLADRLGPHRGAEAATHHLNIVYGPLVDTIHGRGGSVVSFSGDGMLCWFAGGDTLEAAARQAVAAAAELHTHMAEVQHIAVGNLTIKLGLKVALATGTVRRIIVGDPAIQVFDVLAGEPVDAVGMAEPLARQGEMLASTSLVDLLRGEVTVTAVRTGPSGQTFARLNLSGIRLQDVPVAQQGASQATEMEDIEVRPWLFPAVFARLAAGQERFLAELRPGVAFFLRVGDLDLVSDPNAAALLDQYVRWVQGILARDDALLVQVTTGDKGTYLYAAYGAIVLHDDDMLRAVYAALSLLSPPPELSAIGEVQIGLAQGRMRVGAYGSDTRRTFGVQGAAANLAARLMMYAPANSIVVAEEFAQQIEGRFGLVALGPVTLKGVDHPLLLHRVVGMREVGPHPRADGARDCVGRKEEMAALVRFAVQARAGQGCVCVIEGDAGIGKSALLRVLAVTLVAQGWRMAAAEAQSIQRHLPYATLGRLLRTLLGLPYVTEHDAEAVDTLIAWAIGASGDWVARLPVLREVIGLPLSDTSLTAGLDPETRRQAIISLVVDIVAFSTAEQPVVLLIDDSQWLDEASFAVLGALAGAAQTLPLLLVFARRTSTGADLVLHAAEQVMRLPGLDAAAIAELAARQLQSPIDALVAVLVNAMAQGNPLVLSQVLDALDAGGRLIRRAGRVELSPETLDALRAGQALAASASGWRFAESQLEIGSILGLPDSLHGLMLARVDRLPEAATLTLKLASVVGRVFDVEMLSQAHPLGAPQGAIHEDLDLLERHGLVARQPVEAKASYRFEHNLTQELVYQTLLSTQQQELHGRVGCALEIIAPDAVVTLAHHFFAADTDQPDLRAKALIYLDQAITRLRADYANETALRFLDQALGLEVRPEWRTGRVELLHLLGRRQQEAEALEALATTPGASPLEHGLLESRYYEAVNDYPAAHAAAVRAFALATAADDRVAQASCLVQMARVTGREGGYAEEGRTYQAALLTLSHDATALPIGIEIYYGLGIVARQQGEFDQAEEYLGKALELARGRSSLVDEARILTALGIVARMAGRFDDAIVRTERSLAIRRMVGDRAGEAASLMSLAQVLIHGLGDFGQGRDYLNDALEMAVRLRDRWSQGIVLNELGIVYLLVGAWDSAERFLLEALAICEEIGAEAGAAHVLCNLGQVQHGQGRLEAAQATFARGDAIAAELQDPHLQTQYWSEMALLALHQGDAAHARGLAQQSIDGLRRLELEVMTTADLCTMAEAQIAMGSRGPAVEAARAALAILEACHGKGPDYPQRDYYRAGRVLAECGEPGVEAALAAAIRILERNAQRIGDDTLRYSFLHAVPTHAAIMAEAHGIASTQRPSADSGAHDR